MSLTEEAPSKEESERPKLSSRMMIGVIKEEEEDEDVGALVVSNKRGRLLQEVTNNQHH